MSADSELSDMLSRRRQMNEDLEEGKPVQHRYRNINNLFAEFHELSRKQIKHYEETFNKYDCGHDGYLDCAELKLMMERLGAPQTHVSLKAMIAEVDEDNDSRISFREFLLIYRKAMAGELSADGGLNELARLTEVKVEEVGVAGAKNFFEAKIEEVLKGNKFHDEIKEEQEERRREQEEKETRRQHFREKAAIFQN